MAGRVGGSSSCGICGLACTGPPRGTASMRGFVCFHACRFTSRRGGMIQNSSSRPCGRRRLVNDSDTTIDTRGESVVVTTGELQTVFRCGDDVAAANQIASLHTQIERLQEERDECRRLLLQVADEWDRLNRNKPGNRPIAPIVLLREWREAARAAGGES